MRLLWPQTASGVAMREVSTRDLKDKLSEWVRLVEEGHRVLVTRSGRPVIALVPLADLPVADAAHALAELAARGAVRLPTRDRGFQGTPLPARGCDASPMVREDRR